MFGLSLTEVQAYPEMTSADQMKVTEVKKTVKQSFGRFAFTSEKVIWARLCVNQTHFLIIIGLQGAQFGIAASDVNYLYR